jgi:hypothetical protein
MASKDFGRNAGPACPHCGSAAAPGLTEERAAICPSCGLVIDGPGFTTEKSPSQFNAGGPAPKKVISRHAPYLTSFMRGVTDPAVQLDQRKVRLLDPRPSLFCSLPGSFAVVPFQFQQLQTSKWVVFLQGFLFSKRNIPFEAFCDRM